MKLFVLAYDHESVVPRVAPDCPIGCRRQAYVADVDGAGIQISERPDKARRKILVEEQPGGLLRQPGYSRPGAPARRRKQGRRGCPRA